MNHLSRQAGLIVFLAAAVITTSMAERSSECTDGENYSSKWLPVPVDANYPADCDVSTCGAPACICLPNFCPGIDDVVVGFTNPFQRSDTFPGNFPIEPRGNSLRVPQIGSSTEFWVEGKKNETLQCFKSKGYNRNIDVSEDGSQTVTVRGHIVLGLGPYEQLNYKFSGLNPNNITGPGLYYMQGGEYSYDVTKSNETGTVITTEDYTKITGTLIDMCEVLEAALNSGGDDEEEDTCASKAKDDCNEDENCMWKRKKKCVPIMPTPWN